MGTSGLFNLEEASLCKEKVAPLLRFSTFIWRPAYLAEPVPRTRFGQDAKATHSLSHVEIDILLFLSTQHRAKCCEEADYQKTDHQDRILFSLAY